MTKKSNSFITVIIVKMDAVQKKNIAMQNVAPGSYERHLKDKKAAA